MLFGHDSVGSAHGTQRDGSAQVASPGASTVSKKPAIR
jgi:hypothetical protein